MFDEEAATSNMVTIERVNMHVELYVMILKLEPFEPIQVLSSVASLTQTSSKFQTSNQSHTRGIKLKNNGKVEFHEG